MPYTFTITEVVNNIAVNTTATNIAVTLDNINFVVTSTNQVFNLTQTYNTVTVYENAVELKLSNLNTFWKGNWATSTSYYNGDFVDYQYSTYLLKDVYLNSDVPYNSNTIPPSDSNWQRIQWHEAPFAYLTVTNGAIIGTSLSVGSELTAGSASVNGNLNSVNLTVSGGSVLAGARVNGALTATSISSPSATITDINSTNITSNFATVGNFTVTNAANIIGQLNVGGLSSNGVVNINGGLSVTGATTITNILTVNQLSVGGASGSALAIDGNVSVNGSITSTNLAVTGRSTFLGTATFNGDVDFPNTTTSLSVANLTVNGQFITGGLRYPRNTGEYGQVLFTNGSTGTAWVNLGDLVFWDLSADLITNGYKIISGAANTELVLGVGTSTAVTNRIRLSSTGTNIYGDLLPNNIKFPDGSNQTTAYLGVATTNRVGGVKVGNNLTVDGGGLLNANTATSNTIGVVIPGSGLSVTSNGTISVNTATANVSGIVKVGPYLSVDSNSVLSVNTASLVPFIATIGILTATNSTIGGIKVGSGFTVDPQTAIMNLNTASVTTLGGVKVGSGLTITQSTAVLAVNTATTTRPGIVQVGDYLQIDKDAVLSLNSATIIPFIETIGVITATQTTIGGIKVGNGFTVNSSTAVMNLNTASVDTFGGVKVGSGLTITQITGILSVNTATTTRPGIVQVGSYLQIDKDAVLSLNTTTIIPFIETIGVMTATETTIGGIKVGSGFTVNSSTAVMNLNTASGSVFGGVRIGTYLTSTNIGTVSVNTETLTAKILDSNHASNDSYGVVKIGTGLSIDAENKLVADLSTDNLVLTGPLTTNGFPINRTTSGVYGQVLGFIDWPHEQFYVDGLEYDTDGVRLTSHTIGGIDRAGMTATFMSSQMRLVQDGSIGRSGLVGNRKNDFMMYTMPYNGTLSDDPKAYVSLSNKNENIAAGAMYNASNWQNNLLLDIDGSSLAYTRQNSTVTSLLLSRDGFTVKANKNSWISGNTGRISLEHWINTGTASQTTGTSLSTRVSIDNTVTVATNQFTVNADLSTFVSNTLTFAANTLTFNVSSVDFINSSTLRLKSEKVYIGTDIYHSTLFVERIESFDENGSVFFPGGVKFPDNTTQLTAYPGDFGVLGP